MNSTFRYVRSLSLVATSILALSTLAACDVVEPQMEPEAAESPRAANSIAPNMMLGPPTVYSGLRYYPMGNAILGDACGGSLTILGIGSSGLDGVCLPLDAYESADNSFRTLSPLDTRLNWSARGEASGTEFLVSTVLELRDSEIVLRFDGSQSPATDAELVLLENNQAFERHDSAGPDWQLLLHDAPAVERTSLSAVFGGESAGGSGLRMDLYFESPVTVTCPNGGEMTTDQVQVTWPMPLDDLQWMQDFMFTQMPGSSVTTVEMVGSQVGHKGLTIQGTCESLLGVQNSGGWVGVQGDIARAMIGGLFDQPGGLQLNGVTLDTAGESFKIDIDGLSPNKSAQSLVLNLSLGWHPAFGLSVDAAYPHGAGYQMTVLRRGNAIVNVTRANGQSAWALPGVPATGFALQAINFDPDSYAYDAVGNVALPSGKSEAIRIRLEPVGQVSAPAPSTLGLEYDQLALGSWFFDPRSSSEPAEELPIPIEVGN